MALLCHSDIELVLEAKETIEVFILTSLFNSFGAFMEVHQYFNVEDSTLLVFHSSSIL